MQSINNSNINTWPSDDIFTQAMYNVFPEFFEVEFANQNKTHLQKLSYKTGRTFGKAKNFFSKTETKAATLVAYWAADAFVALVLILSSSNPIALAISIAMLILHTYATFSVINEIL